MNRTHMTNGHQATWIALTCELCDKLPPVHTVYKGERDCWVAAACVRCGSQLGPRHWACCCSSLKAAPQLVKGGLRGDAYWFQANKMYRNSSMLQQTVPKLCIILNACAVLPPSGTKHKDDHVLPGKIMPFQRNYCLPILV